MTGGTEQDGSDEASLHDCKVSMQAEDAVHSRVNGQGQGTHEGKTIWPCQENA